MIFSFISTAILVALSTTSVLSDEEEQVIRDLNADPTFPTSAPVTTSAPQTAVPTQKPTAEPIEAITHAPTEKPVLTNAPTEKPVLTHTPTDKPVDKPVRSPRKQNHRNKARRHGGAPTRKHAAKPTETLKPVRPPRSSKNQNKRRRRQHSNRGKKSLL